MLTLLWVSLGFLLGSTGPAKKTSTRFALIGIAAVGFTLRERCPLRPSLAPNHSVGIVKALSKAYSNLALVQRSKLLIIDFYKPHVESPLFLTKL